MKNFFFLKKIIITAAVGALALGALCGCAEKSGAGAEESLAGSGGGSTASDAQMQCGTEESSVQSEGTEMKIHCFQAGKADSFLITTEDSAVLIDCGEKGFGGDILDYLEAEGIDSLDALFITHFDKDHVGGAAKVIKNIEIGTVYQSNSPKDSGAYENYIEALAKAELEAVTVREDFSFELGGLVYTVDAPEQKVYAKDPSNNSSLIVTVQDGSQRFVFMGDAEEERIAEYLASSPERCDFLKFPYHGHWQDGLTALVEVLKPAVSVITSSDEEPEDEAVLALLRSADAQVYLTREGPIDVSCDGSVIECRQ